MAVSRKSGAVLCSGLPASPKPGLNRGWLRDGAFFIEKHEYMFEGSGANEMGCSEQRFDYTIGIDVLYRLAMIVAVRHIQDPATRRPRRERVVRRVADRDHLVRRQREIGADLQQRQRVRLLPRQRVPAVAHPEVAA